MADRKIYLATTVSSVTRSNEAAVYTYVNNNPGSSVEEIKTGTGLNDLIVRRILDVWQTMFVFVLIYDLTGTARYWTGGDWESVMVANRTAARNWLDANDGGLESELATALSVYGDARDGALAFAFAEMLRVEEYAKAF